jgi:CubicO group peptidase (beta-lactamase class C family)
VAKLGTFSGVSSFVVSARPPTRALSERTSNTLPQGLANPGRDLPYGLGWFVETTGETRLTGHYGHWDSVLPLVLMVPEKDLTFIAFANRNSPSSY